MDDGEPVMFCKGCGYMRYVSEFSAARLRDRRTQCTWCINRGKQRRGKMRDLERSRAPARGVKLPHGYRLEREHRVNRPEWVLYRSGTRIHSMPIRKDLVAWAWEHAKAAEEPPEPTEEERIAEITRVLRKHREEAQR